MPRWVMVLGTAGLVALSALWGLSGLTASAGAMAHDKEAMIHSTVLALRLSPAGQLPVPITA